MSKLDSTLKLAVFAAFLIVTGLFIWNWDVYYNSDYAMIGLMAKAVLDHGERPLFVWTVGYQGILFEVYAVALSFWAFGVKPLVLNLVPALVYVPLLGAFWQLVRTSFGRRAAWFAVLFLIVSTPGFYGLVLRTQPNYTETFLYGLLILNLYLWMVDRHYVHSKPFDVKSTAVVSVTAGLVGWGMYSYAQVAYFVAAAGAHGLLLWLREYKNTFGGKILAPLKGRWNVLPALFLVVTGFGLLTYIFDIRGVGDLKWEPFSTLRLGVKGFVVIHFGVFVWTLRGFLRRHARWLAMTTVVALGALIIGHSPQLYYTLALKGWTFDRSRMGTSFGEFCEHLSWAWEGALNFLNVKYTKGMIPDLLPEAPPVTPTPVRVLGGLLAGGLILTFAGEQSRTAWRFLKGNTGRGAAVAVTPLVLLPFVVWLVFALATTVMGLPNARYTVAVVLCFAAAIGVSLDRLVRSNPSSPTRLAAVLSLTLALLVHNGMGFYQKLKEHQPRHVLYDVIEFLEGHGITRAYGDFWYAYATTFLANERVIVEPIESNLNPRYKPLLDQAQKVAYIDGISSNRLAPSGVPGQVTLLDQRFKVLERYETGAVAVTLMERVK